MNPLRSPIGDIVLSIHGEGNEEPKSAFQLEICPCCHELAGHRGEIQCGCDGYGCCQRKVVVLVSPDPEYVPGEEEQELTDCYNCWKVVHGDCGVVLGRFEWPISLSRPHSYSWDDSLMTTWC